MNSRQVVLAIVALAAYTGAIFSLGKQFETQAAVAGQSQVQMASSASEPCGSGGCPSAAHDTRPAVAKTATSLRTKLTDTQKASIAAAIKHHKAVVEKANVDLAAAIVTTAKLDGQAKKDLVSQLDITTGVRPVSTGCGAGMGGCGESAGGCGAKGSAGHGSCPMPAPKSASPKKTTL